MIRSLASVAGMLALMPGMVQAAWELGREPGIRSTEPYVRFVRQRTAPQDSAQRSSPVRPRPPAPSYPVTSRTLTPGDVARRSLEHGPQRPVCLVGADQRSLNWIRRYRATLSEVGAICLIVQAKDRHEADRVKRALGDVPSLVASADDIAPKLGLTHYPVLLSAEGVEQ